MTGPGRAGLGRLARAPWTATALTGFRLLLTVPMVVLMSRPDPASATLAAGVLVAAVATDVLDGRAARAAGTAGPRGQLFDHGTDCLFVTAALAAAAGRGALPWLLPLLVLAAFAQYVGDSWWPNRTLRGNRLGRLNGLLYFAVPAVDVLARHGVAPSSVTSGLAWVLVVMTAASMIQRAISGGLGGVHHHA